MCHASTAHLRRSLGPILPLRRWRERARQKGCAACANLAGELGRLVSGEDAGNGREVRHLRASLGEEPQDSGLCESVCRLSVEIVLAPEG